ncbi:TorF family putative porin [Piscinibacter sakaiensis]|uniref:TorF family putative porin n=1 Tax=Piscinibacter sakaiensis TaxID=1547922 RepID=UPI003AAD90FC
MKTSNWVMSMVLALLASNTIAQTAAPAVSISGNLGLFSDYRFRGISQTDRKPALQGGFDLSHASGLYLGNWNSNIDSAFYNGSNLEMDVYGGYRREFGGVGFDVGAIYYYYPGSGKAGASKIDNTEVYVGATFGPLSAKYSHAVSDFFSAPNTKGSRYFDLAFAQDLGNGLGINAHVGHQRIRNTPPQTGRVTDFKVGVSYDLSGYVLGASYIGTNRDRVAVGPQSGKDLGKDAFVLSVVKTF